MPEPRPVPGSPRAAPEARPGPYGNAPRPASLRARVVGTALVGVVLLTWFVQWSDLEVGGTMAAGPFPPLAACLLWAALLALNALAARRFRRPLLTRGELLVTLAVWLTANMAAGRGLLHPLLASLVGPTYYARGAAVSNAVARYLPATLAVTDRAAARGFYEGHAGGVPWSVWMRPLMTWALFFLPFLTAGICLSALFERVWTHHERLAFPLVALPIEALGSGRGAVHGGAAPVPLWRRKAFWAGLAVPLTLHGFGVANAYAPAIPCLPFFNDVSSAVTNPPWTALRPLYLNLYPLLIGLTFLAPTDVTLGVWVFLLLNKAELLATAMAGWNEGVAPGSGTQAPYLEEQSAGAYLALGAMLTWNARGHLGRVWRAMRGQVAGFASSSNRENPALEGESSETRAYAVLGWGFVLGVAGTLAWCVWAGLPLWFAVPFLGFLFTVSLVLGRLMAEGGIAWILAPILPDKLIMALVGSRALSPLVLTRLTQHVQHLRDTRQALVPAAFQAGKLRDEASAPLLRFYGLLLASVALALIVGVGFALPRFYQEGALSLAPNSDGLQMSAIVIPTTAVGQASSRLLTPVKPSPGAMTAVGMGAAVTGVLSALRLRFAWWSLHPLGYALTGTLQQGYANKMLLSVFLGWMFKALTLRFGGVRGFRLLRDAALGLICGDLLMGGILKLLDVLLGPSGYAIF